MGDWLDLSTHIQKKNQINITSATKDFAKMVTWLNMSVFILKRSHSNVNVVRKDFLEIESWLNTSVHILKRSHWNVNFVRKYFLEMETWMNMNVCILKRSHSNVSFTGPARDPEKGGGKNRSTQYWRGSNLLDPPQKIKTPLFWATSKWKFKILYKILEKKL